MAAINLHDLRHKLKVERPSRADTPPPRVTTHIIYERGRVRTGNLYCIVAQNVSILFIHTISGLSSRRED